MTKTTKIINIGLVVLIFFLILNLIQPIKEMTGKVVYELDSSSPECYFINGEQSNQITINNCCNEIQKQLRCEFFDKGERNLKCYTSRNSQRYYLINGKAFNYCEIEGYDVKIE